MSRRTRSAAGSPGAWRGARLFAALALVAGGAVAAASPARAAGSAPGTPGANATWNESNVSGFADSLGSASKVWYTLGDGELENVFYPETDTPGTFGLQYIVTDGSSFTDTETANTSHAVSLADPTSLVWQQVNTRPTATSRSPRPTSPTRPARLCSSRPRSTTSPPSRSSSTPTTCRSSTTTGWAIPAAPTRPAATWWRRTARSPARSPPRPVSPRPPAATSGTSSDGSQQLTSSHTLTSTYTSASTAGHIVQVAQIPVASSGATTFTLALGFDSSRVRRHLRRRRVAEHGVLLA